MSFLYRKNVYQCERASCGHEMVTVDRDEGVTPFITSCPKCTGPTRSTFYRGPQGMTPTHEWYRPDEAEITGLKPAAAEHVKRGGLILREIKK